MKEISPEDNIFDSRTALVQFEKLTAERDSLSGSDLEEWKEEYEGYYNQLSDLNDEGLSLFGEEWEYGVTLVNEDYFIEHAKDFAEEIGAIDAKNFDWPSNFIDWDGAAESLKRDYQDLVWCSTTFYGRY